MKEKRTVLIFLLKRKNLFSSILYKKSSLRYSNFIKQTGIKKPLYAVKQLVEQNMLTITHEVTENFYQNMLRMCD